MAVNKLVALVVVALGALLVLRVFSSLWLLFLIVAVGLALGASSGAIGKWGYAAAAFFGLLALPALLFKTMFAALSLGFAAVGLTVKLLPYLLLAYGAYVLLKALSK